MVKIRTIKHITLVLLVLLTFCFFGCADKTNQDISKDSQVLTSYEKLLQAANEKDILVFIDQNISRVSRETADKLVNGYENLQKNALDDLNKQFSEGKEEKWTIIIPQGLQKEFGYSFTMEKIDSIKDKQLRETLQRVRDTGYLVRTDEGMYFPVINYDFYTQYSRYLTGQMKDYYLIMAHESKTRALVDGALLIKPDDILKRIEKQEIYIKNYPGSSKLGDIKDLYINYVRFYLFGIDNTPAFSYNSKALTDNFKQIYQNFQLTSTILGKEIAPYFETLKNEGYMLTNKVATERNKVLEKIKKDIEYN
ncbi:MAG: hypothetical protein STSR0004_14010 [Peptococcaceae bacterium]